MKTKPHRINKRIMAVIISFAIVIGVIAAPQMGIQTYAAHEWDFKIDKLLLFLKHLIVAHPTKCFEILIN